MTRLPTFFEFVTLVGLVVAIPSQTFAQPTVKPYNLPVNTKADEDEPHVTDNGLTLYWTSNLEKKDDLWFTMRRTSTARWPAKGRIVEDYVSTAANDRSVFSTYGRYPHYLYFATQKDVKSTNFDLYVALKHDVGKAWSAPTPVMSVNSPSDELHPWITADGKSLYFSRKTKSGWSVFVSGRDGTTGPQGWGEPKKLELPNDFHHATLTPDGKTMYLQGPLDSGRWGLFVSRRTATGWSDPKPLNALLQHKGKSGDRSPNLSRDGRLLYWASDRPGGRGGLDLWGIALSDLSQ